MGHCQTEMGFVGVCMAQGGFVLRGLSSFFRHRAPSADSMEGVCRGPLPILWVHFFLLNGTNP